VYLARSFVCVIFLIALMSLGCDNSPKLYPASGTVTYQGKPVEGANVSYVPTTGIQAIGITDANGKFTLTTGGKPGAAAGKYQVTVIKESSGKATAAMTPEDMKKGQGSGEIKSKALLPPVYASVSTTTLTATVETDAAKNNATFDLK